MGSYEGIKDEWDKFKDQKEQWEDLQDAIPDYEPPPDHLWNIPGTDIWITPNEPVMPGDCDAWPASCESPFNPMDGLNNTSLTPGIDISTSESECSLCISFTPNIGVISLPPYTICRIKEECQEPEGEPEDKQQPFEDSSGFLPEPPLPTEWPGLPYERLIYFKKHGGENHDWQTEFDAEGNPINRFQNSYDLSSSVNLYDYSFLRYFENDGYTPIYPPFYGYVYMYQDGASFVVRVPPLWKLKLGIGTYEGGNLLQYLPYFILPDGSTRSIYTTEKYKYGGGDMTFVYEPTIAYIWRKLFTYNTYYNSETNRNVYVPTIKVSTYTLRVSEEGFMLSPEGTPNGTPAPIPTPSPQVMPTCCDLEPILKAVRKLQKTCDRLEKVIAPEEFYKVKSDGSLGTNIALIPKRFLYPLASGSQPVTNLPKMLEYIMRHIDRSFGATSWEVVIADSDPATPGNQKLPIQVHSTNDGLKAILQFLVDQATEKNGLPALTFENVMWNQKALVCIANDLATTKKLAVHNNHFLQNIEDHLDYAVQQKEIQVPFAINVNLRNFSHEWKNTAVVKQLFNPKKHTVVVTENIDKVGLGETLGQISRNASIAASPRVVKYEDKIIDKLVDAAELELRLSNAVLSQELKKQFGIVSDDEMKQWVEDAQKAYNPSGGNSENSPETTQQQQSQNIDVGKYYGNKKPAEIKNTTKRSRRRRRRL